MVKRVDSRSDFEKLCLKVGSTKEGIAIMKEKSNLYYFYINSLKTPACNILKQELLSIGAEVAVGRGVINCASKTSDALIVVNKKQLKLAIKKLSKQPFGLKELAKSLKEHLSENSFDVKIMGVINANDDSFYQKSRFSGSQAVKKISIMIKEGANIIDIGGVSSRPGSEYVGEEEEFKRVKPIIDEVYSKRLFEKAMFSLDSFSPKCLSYALDRGFKIVNDITALESDEVAKLAGEYKAKVVLMHKKGNTKDMQENPFYQDVILEVDEFFKERIEKAKSFGIDDIVLDVGIGFGKRLEDNLNLIKNLEHFKKYGYELLVGASRKSMIDMITPSKVEERLAGTLTLHQEAINRGASILRVHDVKEHKQMVEVLRALKEFF